MDVSSISTKDLAGVLLPILTPLKQKKKNDDVVFKINTTLAIPSGRQNDLQLGVKLEPAENEIILLSVPPSTGCIVAPSNIIPGYDAPENIIFMNVSNAQIRLEVNEVVLVAKVITISPAKKKKEDPDV